MSYARFSHCDVYVFFNTDGKLECCGCILQEREYVEAPEAFFGFYLRPVGEIVPHLFDSTAGMVAHLDAHRKAGHYVPPIEAELWEDDAENFPQRPASPVGGEQ